MYWCVMITNRETQETNYIDAKLKVIDHLTDLCMFNDYEDAENVRQAYVGENVDAEDFYIIEVAQF